MINNPQPASIVTQPRGMVLVNGDRAVGLLSFEVDNNSYFQADTFRLTLALSGQPANRDFKFWAAQTSLQVELLVGFPQNPDNFTRTDLKSLLVGYVDDIQVDPLRDEITMAGRDLTSLLIDTKRSIAFTNMTSSDIAIKIAKEMGLNYLVEPTKKFTGTMAQIVTQMVGDRSTYWDVLTKLAQIEHYTVSVTGHTLNFVSATPPGDFYELQYQAPVLQAFPVGNFTAMKFSRNLSVTRGIKVTVMSWNQKTGKMVKQTASRSRVKNTTTSKSGSNGLPPLEYTFVYPNMTDDAAQAKATALAQDISQHEVNLDAEMPGDDLLTTTTPIKVTGTDTAFDQTYYPASIQRRYSWDDGYRMTVRARNYSPETQLT
ncbi:MAG: hypothetical protein HHJ15_18170 [Rhodoferax sp.]|uniref:hypothetical protein n=1 Tax=Rhodoferax sp. TaxID=50421 RepID=UPI0017E9847A|nr:hypothetical protein [Rhodoferax sp.]NMM21849.1 hypothetical protein [Rhodoferax sp.]